jgi:hypothetical protein
MRFTAHRHGDEENLIEVYTGHSPDEAITRITDWIRDADPASTLTHDAIYHNVRGFFDWTLREAGFWEKGAPLKFDVSSPEVAFRTPGWLVWLTIDLRDRREAGVARTPDGVAASTSAL